MPAKCQVTVLVEPLDGTPGYQIVIPLVTKFDPQPVLEDGPPVWIWPAALVQPEGRVKGLTLELDIERDEQGVAYRLTRLDDVRGGM